MGTSQGDTEERWNETEHECHSFTGIALRFMPHRTYGFHKAEAGEREGPESLSLSIAIGIYLKVGSEVAHGSSKRAVEVIGHLAIWIRLHARANGRVESK